MDLRLWLPLWEKCPELRPEGMTHEMMPMGGWWLREPHPRAKSVSSHIHDRTAAALIRDAAVWWLARKGVVLEADETGMKLRIVRTPESVRSGEAYWSFMKADPTEALYLFCCKALGMESQL